MNATHLHLVLNHVTVLGNLFGLVLLAYACWRKSEDLKKESLCAFLVAAVVAVPVFLTGEPTARAVKYLPGVSQPLLARHEEVAQLALALVLLLGLASLAGLFVAHRRKTLPAWFSVALLALSLVSGCVLAWTANLGGQIRHSEIRAQG